MKSCESRKQKPRNEGHAHHQAEDSQHGHADNNGTGCPHVPFPDVCTCDFVECCEHDCDNKRTAVEHRKILSKIAEIEDTYNELIEAVDETVCFLLPVNHDLKIECVSEDKNFSTMLKYYNSTCMAFGLNEELVQAPPGRPFCVVWPKSGMHCHVQKISMYSPTDCDCTKDRETGLTHACPCERCILRQVEHCAEDYKDALRRVKLGITKLQAVPRKDAGVMPSASAEGGDSGGSAMPGVRKAKHLKQYTKAQMKAHNGWQ